MPAAEWTLVICSGGSGGHLFPALAVLEELRSRENPPSQVLVFSTQRDIERRIAAVEEIEHVPLEFPAGADFLHNPFKAGWNIRKSIQVAQRFLEDSPRPVVLGMGGFGSVPGVLAASNLQTPIVLHEQNVVPGRATSWLARRASVVCVSFEETRKGLPQQVPCTFTGNPVRREIAQLHNQSARDREQVLLVLGGSQGAHAINQALLDFAKAHRTELADWRIVHQTGEQDAKRVSDGYRLQRVRAEVAPFFDDLGGWYQQAAIAVTRAGATSLAELACAGVSAVVIPYPKSVRDHQLKNANWYADRQGAVTVEQTSRDKVPLADRLASELLPLMQDAPRREGLSQAMQSLAQPTAAARVADVILSQARE